jgi:hypothetical protein
MDAAMKCYLCGAEPDMVEVSTLDSAEPKFIPGHWPVAEDHVHALAPPTPAELERAGHEALRNILEDMQ